mgnify:CR=1 FL=1
MESVKSVVPICLENVCEPAAVDQQDNHRQSRGDEDGDQGILLHLARLQEAELLGKGQEAVLDLVYAAADDHLFEALEGGSGAVEGAGDAVEDGVDDVLIDQLVGDLL